MGAAAGYDGLVLAAEREIEWMDAEENGARGKVRSHVRFVTHLLNTAWGRVTQRHCARTDAARTW